MRSPALALARSTASLNPVFTIAVLASIIENDGSTIRPISFNDEDRSGIGVGGNPFLRVSAALVLSGNLQLRDPPFPFVYPYCLAGE